MTKVTRLRIKIRPIFASDETWKRAAGSAALVAWCGISIASARAKRMAMGLGLFAVVSVALMLSTHFILPKWGTWSRAPEAFVAQYTGAIGPEDQVYSTNYLAPFVGWVLKRNDHDDAQKHAQIFGIAVIFLQIAILLSSIAALMKKKPVWVLGLILGAFGVIYFINGFFLFLRISYLLF
jgi:hypothetical protein